jgi:TonB family protein
MSKLMLAAAIAAATPFCALNAQAANAVAPKSPPVEATVTVTGDEYSPAAKQVVIWPASAHMQRTSGQVTLSCFVDARGFAERCGVIFERPGGMGFGDAALALRPQIRVTPHKGSDGQPAAAQMNIGVAFRAPTETRIEADMDPMGFAARVDATHNPLPVKKITLMTNPVWAQAPSFDAAAAAYPADGGAEGGYAVAHCGVTPDGQLTNCRMATEAPVRKGFGPAAVKLAPQFRVRPEIMARAPRGEPIEVDVPIRFDPPGAERTVNAPTWIQGFDPATAPKLFPPEAAAKGLTTGRGVARCTVGRDGAMTGCQPDAGDPEGLGFSEAAAKLASTMRMNLWSADAGPVEGGVARVAIRLNLSKEGRAVAHLNAPVVPAE